MLALSIVSLVSGLLLAAPFLSPSLFPLAWIIFVPLFWALQRSETPRRAFSCGWIAGGLAHLVGFYWLHYAIRVFGGFSSGLSALILLLFAIYSGLALALFSLLVRRFGFGPLNLFPPLFWVAIEFWFPHLFPWYLANAQSQFLTLIQSADLVGPSGTSFLVLWGNAVLASLLPRGNGRPSGARLAAATFGIVANAVLFYGHLRLSTVSAAMERAPKLGLAAIQGNIGIQQKWDPDQWKDNLRAYQELTDNGPRVGLVIWPETAVEVWLPESISQLPGELLPAFPSATTFFIFGVRSFRGEPSMPNFKAFNSAFLTDAKGRILGRYHKQLLLAFGEYIPFSALLSKLPGVPALGDGFSEGAGPETLDLSGGIRVAPLICYEDLMPVLARKFVLQKKAHLLVNLTNDAWYGRTVAPWQHARLAQWRAIETRRSLVRVTNTGLTTVINPRGEMVEALPTFARGVLQREVELMEGETLYVRFGDWFAWGATLLSLGILVLCWRKRPTSLS